MVLIRVMMDILLFRRGSPMVIGVKCVDQLIANHIPVMFSKGMLR